VSASGSAATPAVAAADAYVETISAGRFGAVPSLFALDGLCLPADGNRYSGRDEIARFYTRLAERGPVRMRRGLTCRCGAAVCMWINEVETPSGYEPRAVNVLTCGNVGLIERLEVFVRPPSRGLGAR
jgi:hypothetical protein